MQSKITSAYKLLKGFDHNALRKVRPCTTVGELVALLTRLPQDLPIDPCEGGVKLVWYNVGHEDEELGFEEGNESEEDDEFSEEEEEE